MFEQDWAKTNLEKYLRYGKWDYLSGMLVLTGFDYRDIMYPVPGAVGWAPDSRIIYPEVEDTLHPASFYSLPKQELDTAIVEMRERLKALQEQARHELWDDAHPFDTPENFIQWSVKQHVVPAWLDWAIEKGYCKAELNPVDQVSKQYGLDPDHECYPPELDWALKAWRFASSSQGGGKPKARILKWLNEHADKKELSDAAKERISVVANWEKKGGPTRTG